MAVKPTPTQEENDRAALGEHVLEKEDDGSGPDPNNAAVQNLGKAAEPKKPSASYQTRQATPAPHRG